MKVVFTRRSCINRNDFDFLTEGLLQERSEVQKRKRLANRVNKRIRTLEALTIYEAPNIPIVETRRKAVDLTKNARMAASGDPQKAIDAFLYMMSKFGNSLTGIFKQFVELLKGLPALASRILKPLKSLLGKIKGWFSKLHILDRAKSLSLIAVSCIGFIAGIVGIWLHRIIYRKDTDDIAVAQEAIDQTPRALDYYIRRFKDPEKYIHSTETPGWIPKKSWDESAVFIETFGEILREDSNGGMFIAMTRKTIAASIDKIDAICKVAKNSSNIAFKKLSKILSICINGSNAIITNNII